MAEGITAYPNTYGFGLEFDYSVWTPGTQVDLVNVPFTNDYRDVVRYDSQQQFNNYIDSLRPAGLTFDKLSYIKPNQPVRLPITHSKALKYNYLRVSNPLQPVESGDELKHYYYFIIDVQYDSPESSKLILQLDVWSTYIYNVSLGRCYVERGHIGIANSNAFNNYGRDYLTTPEGLDVGGEYVVAGVRKRWVMSPTPFVSGSRYPSYDLLVVSTTDLLADPGTKEDPDLVSASGSTFQGTNHGAAIYIFDSQSFMAYLSSMKDKPWVTQGIVSITMIPKVNRYHPGFSYAAFPLPSVAPPLAPRNVKHSLFENWRNNPDFVNIIPPRYRHLQKFKTYPYTVVEMTTHTGGAITIKPESWNNADGDVMERASLVPPGQRVEFWPHKYNAHKNHLGSDEALWPAPIDQGTYLGAVTGDDWGDYVDMVTQIANFPTMAIVNDGAISYLAANTHAIANQFKGADWSQSRALGMAQGQYDIATGAMHTAMDVAGSAMNADIAQTGNLNRTQVAQAAVQAASGFVGGAGAGAVFGPVGMGAGAISGAANGAANLVNAGIGAASNDEALAIRNRAAAETLISQNRQQQLVRDTNKDLADWAARGDYAIQHGALNAKVQDANLIQPSTSGQTGGETINIVNGGLAVSLRWKTLDEASFRAIGEYWLRYGYAIRASIIPPQTLKVMSKFTYWKLSETYIASGPIPEGHKQALRGILEKGVTVWNNPREIGLIDWADNVPLAGVSY